MTFAWACILTDDIHSPTLLVKEGILHRVSTNERIETYLNNFGRYYVHFGILPLQLASLGLLNSRAPCGAVFFTFRLMTWKRLALLKDEQRLEGGRRVHDQRRNLDRGEDEFDGEVADVVGEVVGRHVARVLQREPRVLRVTEGLEDLGASLIPAFVLKCYSVGYILGYDF